MCVSVDFFSSNGVWAYLQARFVYNVVVILGWQDPKLELSHKNYTTNIGSSFNINIQFVELGKKNLAAIVTELWLHKQRNSHTILKESLN